MSNQILVLTPYWLDSAGTWVFDDPLHELYQEPFIEGIPTMIDHLTRDIPDARKGFRLLFSAEPFPSAQEELVWGHEESGGNWYWSPATQSWGWLCPALLKFFDKAPPRLYAKAEPLERKS